MNPVCYPQLDRADWLKLRQQGLGASDIGSVIGVGFVDPFELYAEKVAPAPVDRPPSERMKMGLALAPIIRARYAEAAGWEPSPAPGLVRHPDRPWPVPS